MNHQFILKTAAPTIAISGLLLALGIVAAWNVRSGEMLWQRPLNVACLAFAAKSTRLFGGLGSGRTERDPNGHGQHFHGAETDLRRLVNCARCMQGHW